MNKLLLLLSIIILASCSTLSEGDTSSFPKDAEGMRAERRGKITGEEGLVLFGGDDDDDKASGSGIGVNSFLWRATLDTIGFMPIDVADPFGGVITTEYYEDPAAAGERFKINALIMDERLRADGVKVTVFKQTIDEAGTWREAAVDKDVARQIEDKILTRARELRIQQTGR
mgnify:FL=1